MAQTGRVLKVLLKIGLGLFLVALIVVSLFRRDWFVMYIIESLEMACYFGFPGIVIAGMILGGFLLVRNWLRAKGGQEE